MNFLIVGAGAVGVVLGTLLENDGHRVQFWVRPAQRERLTALSIERVAGKRLCIEAPRLACPGDAVADADWLLVCVRGEQLTAALEEVVRYIGPDRRVAIAAVSLQRVAARARAAGLTGHIFALHAAFGSHAADLQPNHFKWFPFTPPTTITPDGDRAQLPQAKMLAQTLSRAGLPATASLSMNAYMRFMIAVNCVLALSWDMSDWQLRTLVKNEELRIETARAMREAVALITAPGSWQRSLPVWIYGACLRVVARFMGPEGTEVWLHHGPKIRPQTDAIIRELLQLADRNTPPPAALGRLFERWRAGHASEWVRNP